MNVADTTACDVSVVIPTKNRPEMLARLIESIRRQEGVRCEIIVVDDGSSSPVVGLPADVLYLRNETSLGACASRNRGVRAAHAEFVAFFDDDAELDAVTTLERARRWLRAQAKVGAVGFRQADAERVTRGVNPSNSTTPCLAPVFYSYGCLVRRHVLDEVGGFTEPFHYYYEEVELSLRILNAGYDIVYDPGLFVIHHESDVGRDWRRISRLTLQNSLMTVLLLYPAPIIVPGLARALYNGHRAFSQRTGADVSGKLGAAWRTARLWPYVVSHRRPITFGTLTRFRRLSRELTPVPEPA